MPFRLVIDNREKGLISLTRDQNITFEERQLDLGDIIITNASTTSSSFGSETEVATAKLLGAGNKAEEKISNDSKEPEITLVIERKSFTDLKASMSDGRYHEQKSRYLRLPRGTVFYILEDNDPNFESLDYKAFLGMYVHTVIRDQIQVFITRSLSETLDLIRKIQAAVEEFGLDFRDKTPSCSLEASQIRKKKAVGKEVYLQQLACYPGISKTKAKSIAELYPSIIHLVDALKDGSFKVKGIGKVLIEGMKNAIWCSTEDKKIQIKFE